MNYENLEIWKRSTELSIKVYRIFSDLKDYGFKDDRHGRRKCRKRRSGFLSRSRVLDYPYQAI